MVCLNASSVLTTMHNSAIDYFPLKREPRPAQVKALDFIQRMVADGCQDIVIEAPTGSGKSAVGAACCYWAADWPPQRMEENSGIAQAGGYYLVTQKQLQRQIDGDVQNEFRQRRDFTSLWSSASYDCLNKKIPNCQIGLRSKFARCSGRKDNNCPYRVERARFDSALFALTNYPFFMTERVYVGALKRRNIIVMDECHTIEKQLLKFGEIEISDKLLMEWAIRDMNVPEIDDMQMFANWLDVSYLPKIKSQLETCAEMAQAADDNLDDDVSKRITALENQERKTVACISGIRTEPKNWIYWCDQTERDGNVVYCKPLDASPYMEILRSGGTVRVYMSAFPGEKHTFCDSLGLDPSEVAWLRLGSSFPKDNRPVIMGLVGSMSRRNQQTTLPAMLRVVDKIMSKHATEKGIIHCHSYDLGKTIADSLKGTAAGLRLLFPRKAEERDLLVARHCSPDSGPTVLLSPSVTEGFDFKDDTARWQIIAKVPYPYLGDKQVEAKKEISQEWYDQQTIMTIVQAAGRVCRSETDWGVTYVLDDDFRNLWDKRRGMFPAWFKEAIVWG